MQGYHTTLPIGTEAVPALEFFLSISLPKLLPLNKK